MQEGGVKMNYDDFIQTKIKKSESHGFANLERAASESETLFDLVAS